MDVLLAVYAVGVFGALAGTLGAYFVHGGMQATSPNSYGQKV